jgi:ATP-dependent RNA helicase HelY
VIPQGCLIGLDAGDELLDQYRGLNHSIEALRGKERNLVRDVRDLALRVEGRPWPEPGRQALRRFFRTAPPGVVIHTRDGWGIYLGRARAGGVGLFLFGTEVKLVLEYRHIDYLPGEDFVVPVPATIQFLEDPVTDVTTLLSDELLQEMLDTLNALPLPDLDAQLSAHRAELEKRHQSARERLLGQLDDTRAGIGGLNEQRATHPCHTCPRRKEHQQNLKHVNALERERAYVEASLQEEVNAENDRIRGIIGGIRNVLHRFNYLHRGYPTAKADLLADVFDTNGLIICEMIDRQLVDSLGPIDLAEVFSWFAFDRDSRFANHYHLPNHLILVRRRLEDMQHQILAAERGNGLFISNGHNIGFYGAMRDWCRGATMSAITEQLELSEGDLVLTFNKTIDLMRQVREMLGNVAPDHPLRENLFHAERMVKRDIVEQSLTLGFLPIASDQGEREPDEIVAAPVDGE